MRKAMLVGVLALAMTACVPFHYVKDGATAAQFDQDKAQCTYEAKLHQPRDPIMWPDTVSSCLQARGWRAQR